MLDQTKRLVLDTISKHGFDWDDVEDIFPAQNFVSELARSGVIDSARFHFVDLVTTENDPEVRYFHSNSICARVERAFLLAMHALTIVVII